VEFGMPKSPLPDNWFYLASGRVVRQWAFLEFALFAALSHLLCVDQFRARIVWHSLPNIRARRNLLATLSATYHADHDREEFEALLKRLKRLGSNRNLIAHSMLLESDTTDIIFMGDKPDEEFGFNFLYTQKVQPNNILDWGDEIEKLRLDFMNFDARSQVHSSARKHREQSSDPKPKVDPQDQANPEER
jgi:hypothetical protein